MFQKGHKLAPGGARPGAGRPKDWLREQCREVLDKNNLIKGFLSDLASGKGKFATADARDRLRAIEILMDRGYGKPEQQVDMNVSDRTARPSAEELTNAIKGIGEVKRILEGAGGGARVAEGK